MCRETRTINTYPWEKTPSPCSYTPSNRRKKGHTCSFTQKAYILSHSGGRTHRNALSKREKGWFYTVFDLRCVTRFRFYTVFCFWRVMRFRSAVCLWCALYCNVSGVGVFLMCDVRTGVCSQCGVL